MPKSSRPRRAARLRRPPAPYPRVVTFVVLCLVGGLLYAAQEVLIPLALALLLTFLLAPLVALLQRVRVGRVGVGRVPAVLLSVMLGVGVLGGLLWAVESQFVDMVDKVEQYQGQIRQKVSDLTSGGGTIGTIATKIQNTYKAVSPPTTAPAGRPATNAAPPATDASATDATPAGSPLTTPPASPPAAPPSAAPPSAAPTASPAADGAPGVAAVARPGAPTLPNVTPDNPLPVREFPEKSTLGSSITTYLSKSLNPLATAFLVFVFVIFMLLGQDDLRDRLIRLAGTGQLDVTTEALDDAGRRVSRYLLAQSLVNGTYAVLVAAGLWLIGKLLGGTTGGFPNVVLFGLLCGVFRFVPYVGPWLGAAMPLAIAFGFFPTNGVFFATIGLFVVLEAVVSQVAEPLLYGSSTGMSAIAVLVAAAFWAWLWGPVGLLLSTPLTVVLVVMGRYVPQLRFIPVLLGDEPALAPHARVYQRLAALDREQAGDVATTYVKDKGLLAAYDDVLLPALAMAEQNHHRGTLSRRRYRFVRSHVRDLAEELADLPADGKASGGIGESGGDSSGGAGAVPGAPLPGTATSPVVPEDRPDAAPAGRVVCVPAAGVADEIAAGMLAVVLARHGYDASAVPARPRDGADPWAAAAGAAVVCVSALPPAAAARGRRACKRFREAVGSAGAAPGLVVGLWSPRDVPSAAPANASPTSAGEANTTSKVVAPTPSTGPGRPGDVPDAVRRRVACDDAAAVVTTLAAALAAVRERVGGG